jgi:periplasmic protein TonB
MSSVSATPRRRQPPVPAWLRWGLSLILVLATHSTALLLLRRTVPAIGPAAPEAIMLDLAPEPTAPPDPAPVAPSVPEAPTPPPPPPEPPPPEPPPPEPPPPEPLPPHEPPPHPVLLPDVVPPSPQAEIALPPVRPPKVPPPPRPRPARPTPPTPRAEAPRAEAPPPSPPAASPGPAASVPPGQVQATWGAMLAAHLARFKRFPPAAQRRGEQGVVLMRLTISRAGGVLAMTMVRGSGYADLDSEAVAWLTRAQPVPAFPPEVTAQQMEVVVPLRFTLR